MPRANRYYRLLARLIALSITLSYLMATSASAQDEDAPIFRFGNEIRHITGDLYRAGNGAWHSIFLVTEAGIILADPLNPGYAAWLKEQLDERFDVPVRYVMTCVTVILGYTAAPAILLWVIAKGIIFGV